MNRYCVVLCGLQAGVSESSAAWLPVASALKLSEDDFAQRVIAALPLIVRRDLDQASAERIVQLLHAMQADASALPDDEPLVYIRRAEAVRGPLPQSALADFIEAGDTWQVRGSDAWLEWPAPVSEEPAATDAHSAEQQPAADSRDFIDEPDDLPVEAFVEAHVGTSSAPPASDDAHEAAIDATAGEPVDTGSATVDTEPTRTSPPPLPVYSPTQTQAPEAIAGSPVGVDQSTTADALINPLDEKSMSTDIGGETIAGAEAAYTKPPTRSRGTQLVLLLVLAGLAYWAYSHWIADTSNNPAPSSVITTRPASTSSASDKLAEPEQSAPAGDTTPANATSAAMATSAPLPAASTASAPTSSSASAPAVTASTAVTAAAKSSPISTAAIATPAPSASTVQAKSSLPIPAIISPAAKSSATGSGDSH